MRLRTAEGVLVPALFAYAADEFGDEFFDEAWEEFWDAVPDDIDGSREFGTTFDPFFAFSFVPDAAESDLPPGWPTEPVALHFLHQQVESCPDFHREFIEQACRSPSSFFVIEATDPGRSIDLKDILTGKHFHVLEQSASRILRVGDVTFTRVVTAGGASIMIGASSWVIPPSWHLPIIELRDQLSPRRRMMTLADLSKREVELRQLYHQIVDAIVNPKLPTLLNTDGEPIEMTTMTYVLDVSASEAFDRLRPLATLRGEVHVNDERLDAAGGIEAAVLTWLKAGNRKHKDWDNTTLGTLRLDGSRLVIEVNSARRRERITKEVSKRFGSTATLVETTTADIVKELQDRRARAGETAEPMMFSSEPERTPEIQALEAELMQRHWDAWIDTKVPALGNRTPLQAAKTAKSRERLEALLIDFARSAEHRSSGFQPDLGDLRRRLGLA